MILRLANGVVFMDDNTKKELIKHLSQYVSSKRKDKIDKVLKERTDYVSLVLEDINKPHNASATIRTCECLGVQNIHIIENPENESPFFASNWVTQGASKWVNLHRYKKKTQNNTKACIDLLKKEGYMIIATSPDADSLSLDQIPMGKKLAFLFGNEEKGLSNYAFNEADACLRLPMYGFTQSYNISVSVAITFSHVIERLRTSKIKWKLSEKEKRDLKLLWYKKSIRAGKLIEKSFLETR